MKVKMFRRFEVLRHNNGEWDIERYVFDTEECDLEAELFEMLKDGAAINISLMSEIWEDGRTVRYREERTPDGELLKVTLEDGELEQVSLLLNRILHFGKYIDE